MEWRMPLCLAVSRGEIPCVKPGLDSLPDAAIAAIYSLFDYTVTPDATATAGTMNQAVSSAIAPSQGVR